MIDIMVEVVVTKSYIHTVYIPQPHSVDMKPLKKILQPSNNNSQQSIGKQHLSDFIDKWNRHFPSALKSNDPSSSISYLQPFNLISKSTIYLFINFPISELPNIGWMWPIFPSRLRTFYINHEILNKQ